MSFNISNKRIWIQKGGMIVIGTNLVAISYYLFQVPNGIVAPGLGGLVLLLSHFVPISLGYLYFLCNIPLFLIGYRAVGSQFALLSLFGMSCLSLFLQVFRFLPGIHYPFIGCLLSGIIAGIGIGMVILAGGTTGGLDIASVVISRFVPQLSIGKTMLIINGLVLGLSFMGAGLKQTILTFGSMLITSKCVDWILSNRNKIEIKGGARNE